MADPLETPLHLAKTRVESVAGGAGHSQRWHRAQGTEGSTAVLRRLLIHRPLRPSHRQGDGGEKS